MYKRETKNFDQENFILDFLAINWENELDNDVDSATSTFFTKIYELIDKYIPKRKITQEEFKRRFKPWITDHIVNKMKVNKQRLMWTSER